MALELEAKFPRRRLAFWQDRYYIQVYGRQPLPDADLQAFAQVVSATLPAGGEPPADTRDGTLTFPAANHGTGARFGSSRRRGDRSAGAGCRPS